MSPWLAPTLAFLLVALVTGFPDPVRMEQFRRWLGGLAEKRTAEDWADELDDAERAIIKRVLEEATTERLPPLLCGMELEPRGRTAPPGGSVSI